VALYASPAYLARRPRTPLPEHDFCLLDGFVDWFVPMVWKKKELGRQRSVFTGDSVFAVVHAAAQGMGMTALPCYLGDDDPRLVRASRLIEPLTLQLWVLTHADLRHTARVKALMTTLYEALAADADLFEGKRPRGRAKSLFDLTR
jgi:DNA-binding transcriptional LysR family regulator